MFKLVAATFAAILAVASGAAKPHILTAAPVAYSAPVAYGAPVSYGAPVVSAYSALAGGVGAPLVSTYGAPLAYSAHRPVAYLG